MCIVPQEWEAKAAAWHELHDEEHIESTTVEFMTKNMINNDPVLKRRSALIGCLGSGRPKTTFFEQSSSVFSALKTKILPEKELIGLLSL